ncbi:hypothetical protein, partial [Mycobacterium tuberculosis]|uniref:hypothetical protein n=1 Tax=Mycobacterium tuberculosis TaxID=1773 RepID=UPI003F796C36
MIDFLMQQQTILRNILDLFLVFVLLYGLFKVMRGTKGMYFMHGLIVLVLIFAVSRGLKLTLFSWLLDQLMLIVMVGLPIIFQGELKRGLEYLGRKNPLLRWFIKTSTLAPESINAVTEAVAGLAQKRTGALIVFERENPLPGV